MEIKQAIAMHYRNSYHPFVLVSTPEQDVTDGVLQLMIQESRLGEVRVEGNRWSSDARLQEYIQLCPGDSIDESYLIKNVSFINRNPFRRVDLVFMAGSSPGTTDVVLATKDRFPIRLYTGTDNTGVQPTGEGRWYTGFNWGQAFGLDHIFCYQFTSDWSFKKFHAHTFEYTALLSWGHLLEVYGGYSKVHPTVAYPLRTNDGWSFQTSGRYVVPLKIYRYLEQDVTIGGDFKRSNNTFEFTEDFPTVGDNVNLTQLVFGYKGNYERNNFRFDFKGNAFWSPGQWIGDQSNADYATLRPDAVNHWIYFRGAFSYLQRLPKSFSFFFFAEGQVSTQPLLPSEQFGLGGYETVRGYEEREVNKDNALLLSLEMRSPGIPVLHNLSSFRNVSDAIQFLGFLDYGWGINLDPIPQNQIADFLIGIGPGVRYTLEPYLTARLDWGIRLHNKAAFAGGTSMLHFNATASY
jgi:hemolysin activation/secretion protein